jgi:hypothetical protein
VVVSIAKKKFFKTSSVMHLMEVGVIIFLKQVVALMVGLFLIGMEMPNTALFQISATHKCYSLLII